MRVTKMVILIFCFIISLQIVKAQGLSYEEYTVKDGLPSMQTYNIVQDSFGILWIGTENGLVSYDGNEFVRYSHPDLIDNDIVKLVLNRNNRIFFLNLSGQLGIIENNETCLIGNAKIEKRVINIITKKDKDYLVAKGESKRQIYEIKEISCQKFNILPTDIYLFNSGNQEKYIRKDGTEFHCTSDTTVIRPISKYSRSLKSFDRNFNYMGTSLNEIYEVDQKLQKELLIKFPYKRLIKYRNDFFIIGTKGATYYNSISKSFYPFLSDININSIFFDLEGVAWISTPNEGILKISNLIFNLNQQQAKTKFEVGINDIYQDKNGNIYLGSIFSEVFINPFKNSSRTRIPNSQRPVQFIEYNDKIMAFDSDAISTIDINTFETEIFKSIFYNRVTLIIEDDIVFTGSGNGIHKSEIDYYLSSTFKGSQKVNFPGLRISKLFKKNASDIIFAGTARGLIRLNQDSFELVDNEILNSLNVSCIADGDDNSIWIGTRNKGIYNVDNDSILSNYRTTDGLISDNINNIEKYNNELLISTNAGLCIFDLSTKGIKIVSEYNFLPSNEVLVCKVIDGKYWIGTNEGLTILSKHEIIDTEKKRPLLSLKNLLINGVSQAYEAGMILDHTENNIQLNLQNISYKSGREKHIKYRIPLVDSVWIFTTDPNLRLPSLQPEKYQIEAIGINSIGLESKPLNIFFEIDRSWWNKWWARIIAFLILAGVVNLLMLIRSKRIRKEEAVKRNYLSQINKIKDQALQLQMNPHFIFNSLNAIQGFIGTDEEEMAMNYLARFARLIRLIFEHSKGNTITLEEELEFIKLYLDLEKLRFKDKVNIQITIDPELENIKDVLSVTPLLIQPIVENSFKHGLFHKKGKGNLKIEYTIQNEILQVIIEDDGIGRVESSKIAQNNMEKQNSSGIKTTIERIDLLNFGKDKKLNSTEIIDLYDDEGNAMGTKTILKLEVLST